MGHNTTCDVASYSHDISKGAINQSIHKVNEALSKYLPEKYIKLDNPEKAEQSAQKFKDEGFPGKVPWGCLDGTHVLVSPPKDTPHTALFQQT